MSSLVVSGDTSGSVTLQAPAVAGSSVLTLPVATDTLVGKATTDALSNKTLVGVANASSAAAGIVGERVTTGLVSAATLATTGVHQDLGSISLTAGDWDISFATDFFTNGSTGTACRAGIGTASGSSTTGLVDGDNSGWTAFPTASGDSTVAVANYQVQLAATTTYYFKVMASFSAGNPKVSGRMSARRVR